VIGLTVSGNLAASAAFWAAQAAYLFHVGLLTWAVVASVRWCARRDESPVENGSKEKDE